MAVVMVMAVAACGGTPEEAASGGAAPTPDPATTDEPEVRTQAPSPSTPDAGALAPGLDVTLPTVGGGQVTGAELAGRHLALWFWAPW